MCTLPLTIKALSLKTDNKNLTEMETEELVTRVKAMDSNELEIVSDNIPIEYCFNRIEKELAKNKAFALAIRDAMSILEGSN